MTGQTLSHFEILDKLGEGGMGVVYRARDTKLDRACAVKFIRPDKIASDERQRRFLQEARSASALNHPNIVTVYEIGEAGGHAFIAMELVAGRALDQMIPPKGMRLNEALKIGIQVADALARAHAAGITHRDLKPANIMVTPEGRVKILDFGLVKLTEPGLTSEADTTRTMAAADGSPQTAEGTVVGTAAYMSPEQAEGKTVDSRSDIFSLGAVLQEMLSGQRAFQGSSAMATLAAVLRANPAPLPDSVPRELGKVVARCLRKDPERRVQHVSDVKLALEEIKEESESGALATAEPGRRPVWLVPAAAAGLLAVAAGGYALWRGAKAEPVAEVKRSVLTSYPGEEDTPALSPDGKQVAFAWTGEKGGNRDIYVKLVDAGTPVRLTQDPRSDSAPRWSPDGNFLAFVGGRSSERAGGYYVIPALGGAERRVADLPRNPTHAPRVTVDWSPDGKSLVIVDTQVEPPSLALVAVSSGEKRMLTKAPAGTFGDFDPLVSPDGKWLAFSRTENVSTGDWWIQPYGASAPAARRLTDFHGDIRGGGAWMADSTELIVTLTREGETRLWRVAASGSAPPRRWTPAGEGDGRPTVARQGGRAAVHHGYFDSNLWLLDLRDPNAVPLRVVASSRGEQQPDHSADGLRLAFSSSRTGPFEVWTSATDGTNAVQLTHGATHPTAPRWSPDGKRIVFAKRPGGNTDVYVVDAQGGEPRRMTTDPRNDASAYWSLDGQWIYFDSNRTGQHQVWKVRADAPGTDVQVTRKGGWRSREFAGGTMLVYQKWDERGLWKMPVAGGEETYIVDMPTEVSFFATGQTGFWLSSARQLHRVNLQTGEDKVIRQLPPATGLGTHNFSVTSDLRWLVYVQVDQSTNDLALFENVR